MGRNRWPDTDFTAKLIDVYPPSADYPKGYAMNLTDGIIRLRYAEDPSKPRLRRAGEMTRVTITLFPTANLFQPGHRIRLDVSSSNFPKFDVNPNTGEPDGKSAAQTHRAQHGLCRCRQAEFDPPAGAAV